MFPKTDDVPVNILQETMKKNEDAMTTGLLHKTSSPLYYNSFENALVCCRGFYKVDTILQFGNIN
jgi:hypothetical protein